MKFAGLDIETYGQKPEYALQPWRLRQGTAWLTSVVGVAGNYVLDTIERSSMKEEIRAFLIYCAENHYTITVWNGPFDLAWLIAMGLRTEVFACEWLDGLLLYRHYKRHPTFEGYSDTQKKVSFGLKAAVAEFMPDMAGYEDDVTYNPQTPEEWAKLREYNMRDVRYTIAITANLCNEVRPEQLKLAELESRCLPLVADANLRGLCIDEAATEALSAKLNETSCLAYAKLRLGTAGVTDKVLSSPKQLSELLADWGLPIVKLTGSGQVSTDKDVLGQLALIDPRAALIHEYREANTNRTKFATRVLESVEYNGSGRTYPAAQVSGTYTCRMTYASSQGRGKAQVPTGIALHQWKRDPEFRSTITPPEGYTLCEFDFAGQEFRWMAVMSRDTTMLNLCFPGEDAHAYMGASIRSINYKALMQKVADGDKEAKGIRQLGKVANLCVAGDTVVLTDRGPSYIVDIHADDLVWDGIEFVSHDGVVCSGYRQVISYEGVTATPEHKVLVDGAWQTIEDAARHSWRVEPAVGTEGSGVRGAAFRIVGGIVRRHIRDTWCTLRTSAMRLWAREADQHSNDGAWSHAVVQRVCDAEAPQANRAPDHSECSRPTSAEARQRNASALHEPQRSIISKLRRAWYRVSVCDGSRVCSVHQEIPAAFHVPEPRHRPSRQRRSLRSWKLALGYAPTKPAQHAPQRQDMMVYDIVNCGPRTRFSANGKIVHNSLQYRTSPPRLRDMARVQFGIDLDPILAINIHTTYRSTYPGVVRYWKDQANFVKNHSYIENLIGRRVHLLPPAFRDYEYKWSYEVSAVNFPIQSIGADQKYLALSIMRDELPRWRAYFYYELHDGLFFIVPDELAELFVVHSKHLLSNLPYEKAWGKRLPIPFPVDAKLGKSWGALKEYHG